MKTLKEKTFYTMNSAYLMLNNRIDENDLNDSLQIYLLNTRRLYNAMHNKRHKPESVAWIALQYDANSRLKNEEYTAEYTASSEQLKQWLEIYGRGYKTIAQTVEFVKQKRKEREEEERNR